MNMLVGGIQFNDNNTNLNTNDCLVFLLIKTELIEYIPEWLKNKCLQIRLEWKNKKQKHQTNYQDIYSHGLESEESSSKRAPLW